MKNVLTLLAVFVGGAAVGVTAGLLFAPDKGEVQRRKIAETLKKYGVNLSGADLSKLCTELGRVGKKDNGSPMEDFDVE